MNFSILICTRNSEQAILECLYSVLNQNRIDRIKEIVIVDYESSDNTLDIFSSTLKTSNLSQSIVQCNKPGKSPALEMGLDKCVGDYVVILDDDNILECDYLDNALDLIKDKNIGCFSSYGLADKSYILPDWFESIKSVFAIGSPQQNTSNDWTWGAGSIINIEAWKSIRKSGFKFFLNPAREEASIPIGIGGEDVELSLAIRLAGYKILISDKLKFTHLFSENRLTKNYVINNTYGVSKSVYIHEIYRTNIYTQSNINLIKNLVLFKRISRKILGLIFNIVTNFRDDFKREIDIATLKGIFNGYLMLRNNSKLLWEQALKIKQANG